MAELRDDQGRENRGGEKSNDLIIRAQEGALKARRIPARWGILCKRVHFKIAGLWD